MSEELGLVQDFAVIMIVAGVVTLVFRHLRQPPVLGYLLVGLIVGPYTLPFPLVENADLVRNLADLGIILFLFSLGLEFSVSKLRRIGVTVLIIGGVEILSMFALGYGLGRIVMGWASLDSFFLGGALSISSSAIIVKVLKDLGRLNFISSQIVTGVLVLEDFAAVIILAILSGIATSGAIDLSDAGVLALKLLLFAVSSVALGTLFVPRLLGFASQFRSRETMLIISLALCFALAILSKSLGLSVAVGAFLMGAIIGESAHSPDVSRVLEPVRDMFAALFFVAIGMLIEIHLFEKFIFPALLVSAVFLVGKLVANTVGTFICGYSGKVPLKVGTSMGQMGEFSLVIAKEGRDLGVVGALLYPIIVMTTVVTALVSPYIIRYSDYLIERMGRITPKLLKSYLSYLGQWLETLRHNLSRSDEQSKAVRRATVVILIDLIIIVFLVAAGSLALRFVGRVAAALHLPALFVDPAISFTVILLCLPPIFSVWRAVRSIVERVVRQSVLHPALSRLRGEKVVRGVLCNSLMLLVLVAIAIPLVPLVVSLLQLKSLFSLVFPLAILVPVAYLLWNTLRSIHSGMETTFSRSLLGDSHEEIEGAQSEEKEEIEGEIGA